MLLCPLIKGTIVSLEKPQHNKGEEISHLYGLDKTFFSYQKLALTQHKKNVSLAHVPTHYSSCIRRPLKKNNNKKAQGRTRIAQFT